MMKSKHIEEVSVYTTGHDSEHQDCFRKKTKKSKK